MGGVKGKGRGIGVYIIGRKHYLRKGSFIYGVGGGTGWENIRIMTF